MTISIYRNLLANATSTAMGTFNIADVVVMQKWLLVVPDVKLADWKAGDLCEDNIINVFDLCLMKRLLIE